jgi:hypothetical protein
LHFVELDEFRADWQGLGLDVEHDLLALQWELMAAPAKGDLIVGTGGLRKLRFSPPAFPQGNSGGIRVCYCYWPQHFLILLVMAYPKSRKADLSAAERSAIRKYMERTEKWLKGRNDP